MITPDDLENRGLTRARLTRGGLTRRPLTPRQEEILGLIRSYVATHDKPVPAAWVARQLGMTHKGALHHLAALYQKGVLVTDGTPTRPAAP